MPKRRPRNAAEPPPPAPFRRPKAVATLSRARPTAFDLAPSAEDRARIAAFLGIAGLAELRLKGTLAAAGDGWRIEARLTARATQPCVATLVPVEQRIDEPVARSYLPAGAQPTPRAIELDPEGEDEPDEFDDAIDPGELMVEALALALDPYPRAPGAELQDRSAAPPGAEPLDDEVAKPFAGLAGLGRRHGDAG